MADDKKDENLPTNENEALDFGKKKKKKKVKEDLFKEDAVTTETIAAIVPIVGVEYYTGKPILAPGATTEATEVVGELAEEGTTVGADVAAEEIDFGKKKTKKTKVKFDEDQNIEIEVYYI